MGARMPAGSGLFALNWENLRLRKTAWWGWEDSNFRPSDYPLLANSPQLRGPHITSVSVTNRLNLDDAGLVALYLPQIGNGNGVGTDAIRMCG